MNWLHVVRREYVEHVRRKSFLIATILGPLIMLMFLVLPVLFAVMVPDKQFKVTVLDATGIIGADFAASLNDSLESGESKYLTSVQEASPASFDEAREQLVGALKRSEVDIVLAVPADAIETGTVSYITRDVRSFQVQEDFEARLTDIIVRHRLEDEGLDHAQISELTSNVDLELNQISSSGEMKERNFLAEYGLVFIFVMILYMSLLTWGITISRGIIEEKGSRVIEVLLSSLTPRDLMVGKVVGIGLAGLTQLAVWSVVGLTLTAYSGPAALGIMSSIDVPPWIFAYFLLFFVLGFLLYSAMFTVVGSICSTEQDAQQLQGLLTLPLIVPLLCLMLILQSPNSAASVVLSLIPLFTPMIMMARIILVEPPVWQVIASIALLLLSIYGAISFSSRVFRVGVLMYGKRPNLREVIRWYRAAR